MQMEQKRQSGIEAWGCLRLWCCRAQCQLSPSCYPGILPTILRVSFSDVVVHRYRPYSDCEVPGAAQVGNCLSWPEHLAAGVCEN